MAICNCTTNPTVSPHSPECPLGRQTIDLAIDAVLKWQKDYEKYESLIKLNDIREKIITKISERVKEQCI